ncbi:hypothetical protein ACFX2I_004756 [Malus domestica]
MATLSLSSTSQRNFSLYGVSSRSTTTSKFSAFQPRPAKLSSSSEITPPQPSQSFDWRKEGIHGDEG